MTAMFWRFLICVGIGLMPRVVISDTIRAERAAVASVHPLATEAGLEALRRGGNAVDAAVATALTLGVVDGHNSGIGGGCVMIVRLANGRLIAIDGRETAPSAATRDMYLRNGVANPQLSQVGALSVAVPGALMAYSYAVSNFGRLRLADHLQAAAKLAENGFPIDSIYANRLAAEAAELNQFPASRAIFLKPDGMPRSAGEILRQPDLAQTYRAIATHGIGWFYGGPFAFATGQWMATHGGILNLADFSIYQIRLREPIQTVYRGHTVAGFPPPSSGGVHVAEILNIVENFDLKRMGLGSANAVHIVAEAMKLAFADRAHWLGDPDFVRVPRGLVSKPYAAALAKRIRIDRATVVPQYGTPAQAQKDTFEGRHTTHISTADAAGNWVACTATINTSFGSKVVVPGTGVLLNNQMDDFSIQPGVPNFFGLVGADANAIAPGKRPLTSMSPTIVLRNGRPILAIGAAGGPTIISQVVTAIINVVDFGLEPEAAMTQARFHHQWSPNELRVERAMGETVLHELEKRGHKLAVVESFGAAQLVAWRPGQPGRAGFVAVTDPRVGGKAGGL